MSFNKNNSKVNTTTNNQMADALSNALGTVAPTAKAAPVNTALVAPQVDTNAFAQNLVLNNQYTFADQSNMFDGLGLRSYNTDTTVLSNTFKTFLEEDSFKVPGRAYELVPFDFGSSNNSFGAIGIASKSLNPGESMIGLHVVLTGKTDTILGEELVQMPNSQPLPLTIPLSHLLRLADNPKALLLEQANRFLGTNNKVVLSDISTIYTDIVDNPTNMTQSNVVKEIFRHAWVYATLTSINANNEQNGQMIDLDLLAAHVRNDLQSQKAIIKASRIVDNSGVKVMPDGSVRRQDWVISLLQQPNLKNNNNSLLSIGNTTMYKVGGFTEFELVRPNQTQFANSPFDNNTPTNDTKIMMSVCVVSNLEFGQKTQPTLGNTVYALGLAASSLTSNYWYLMTNLSPTNRNANWMHSYAGWGYEIASIYKLPDFVPFPDMGNVDAYNESMFTQVVGKYFNPNQALAWDIPVGLLDSYIGAHFIKAAQETLDGTTQNQDSSTNLILAHTNKLFGGNFVNVFNQEMAKASIAKPMVCTLFNGGRFIQGQYFDQASNTVRSLQDIDRTWFNNRINGDINALDMTYNWLDTFISPNMSQPQKIAQRMNMVKSMLPHSVITGLGVRVTFSNTFLNALTRCMAEYGPTISMDDINYNYGNTNGFTVIDPNLMVSQLAGTQNLFRSNAYYGNVGNSVDPRVISW